MQSSVVQLTTSLCESASRVTPRPAIKRVRRKAEGGEEKAAMLLLSKRVEAIRHASWQALKCRSGRDAMELLLRSERVYLDILQHELFSKEGSKSGGFNLDVHVSVFEQDFDPALEFRGFVSKNKRTALTAYSPWVYDERIIKGKSSILSRIQGVWDEAHASLELEDYSVDFCLSPDLKMCWIVEVNAFLPPLAGCGLFDYNLKSDRELMIQGKGEFEFRIRTDPLQMQDFIRENIDPDTKEVTRMLMQPAPEHVMQYAMAVQLGRHDALAKCSWASAGGDDDETDLFHGEAQRARRAGCVNIGGPACLLL